MGKWGSDDFSGLKDLQARIDKLSKTDSSKFYEAAAKEITARLLNKVKKRTPIVYGRLRDAWTVLPIERRGGLFRAIGKGNGLFITPMKKTEWF